MYKILLVEDELLTRVGIRAFYPWEEDGFTVCGEAANGQEALRLCESLRPDVIFTDIIMPGIDGFDLIRQVKKRYRHICCVVLSCVEEAEKIRQMMMLGACGYFFKNAMNRKDLHELLLRIREELDERKAHTQSRAEIPGPPLMPDGFYLITCEAVFQRDTDAFSRHLSGFIRDFMPRYVRRCIVTPLYGALYWLGFESPEGGLPNAGAVGDLLAENISAYFNAQPTVTYYPLVAEPLDSGTPDVLSERVLEAVESGQQQAAAQSAARLLRHLAPGDADAGKKQSVKLLFELKRLAGEAGVSGAMPGEWDFIASGIAAETPDDTAAILLSVATLAARAMACAGGVGGIQSVLRYLEANYQQSVTLEHAAKIAGMNPSYFSRLFKKTVGSPFVRYLTKLRLEKTRRLLFNPSLTLSAIAERVGFESANYMSAVFKKWYGVAPSEYRQRIAPVEPEGEAPSES